MFCPIHGDTGGVYYIICVHVKEGGPADYYEEPSGEPLSGVMLCSACAALVNSVGWRTATRGRWLSQFGVICGSCAESLMEHQLYKLKAELKAALRRLRKGLVAKHQLKQVA